MSACSLSASPTKRDLPPPTATTSAPKRVLRPTRPKQLRHAGESDEDLSRGRDHRPWHPLQRMGWQPSRSGRPGRSRTRLRPGRGAGQRQRRRPGAGVPPGRRCARRSPTTAWACRPETPRRSAGAPSPPPATATANQPRRPRNRWIWCSWPSTTASSRPTRPPTRARRAATASRGDRDAQLPHRRGAQPGEPAGPPLAHRHHRPARRTPARPSVPPGPGTAAEPTTGPRSGGCSLTPASSTTHSHRGRRMAHNSS